MTQHRSEHVLFSEPYFVARPAILHAASAAFPASFEHWQGRVGVLNDSAAAALAAGVFVDAAVLYYADAGAAMSALARGAIDAFFDDDVVLAPFASPQLALTRLQGNDQFFAVAMALGSRALLNAVDRSLRSFKERNPHLPQTAQNRKTIAHLGKRGQAADDRSADSVPDMDRSLQVIRKRGELRVGVHPGVEGLCMADGKAGYRGLEADLARHLAADLLQSTAPRVRFVELKGKHRLSATRSPLRLLDGARKSFAMFGTLVGTNWWNLGMAGKLPHFLCPPECVGTLDYVGLDYYWGAPSFFQFNRLAAAAECKYSNAPVWPNVLDSILREAQDQFPGKPIVVIENGCVTSADGFSRARYLSAHIDQVRRALDRGAPIEAYLCWAITSNREWGLQFDNNSDFGLYHIDLDTDPDLKRTPTEASARYASIIAASRPPSLPQ